MATENIYFVVPQEYYCVYINIIKRMSNLGTLMLQECKATCTNDSKNLLNCWTMFQTALAAHTLGEIKKADIIINYIIYQLNLSCSLIVRVYDRYIYYGDSDIEPSIETISSGSFIDYNNIKTFNSPFYKVGNYLAIPEDIEVYSIENVNFIGDFLYNRVSGEDSYTRTNITINNKPYILWYCNFLQPLNSYVKITLV